RRGPLRGGGGRRPRPAARHVRRGRGRRLREGGGHPAAQGGGGQRGCEGGRDPVGWQEGRGEDGPGGRRPRRDSRRAQGRRPSAPAPAEEGGTRQGSAQEGMSLPQPLLLVGGFLIFALPARAGEDIDRAIAKGVDFLVADQNEDGSWGSARQTKGLNIYAPVPGAYEAFRAAVTAMAVSALHDSGLAGSVGAPLEALERGEAWLFENLPGVRCATADAIYNVWAHAYGIQALVDLHERAAGDAERQQRCLDFIHGQIDRLARY